MSDGGKGDSPRPYSVSQDKFASNWELTFSKRNPKELEDAQREDEEFERIGSKSYQCWCYNCNLDRKTEQGWPWVATHMILCPQCGNKRCPHSTDHNLACTNSNEPGQPGSRYSDTN